MIKANDIRALKIYHLIQNDVLSSIKNNSTTKKSGGIPKNFYYKNDLDNINFNNTLLIYNTERDSKEEVVFKFKSTLQDFNRNYKNLHFLDLDINIRKTILFGIFSIIVFKPIIFFKVLLTNFKDIKYIFLLLGSQRYLSLKKIDSVIFFTSNSISVEAFRISAINAGITSIEFLHGISTSKFSKYYWLLNILSKNSSSENFYINMQNKLPQPYFIKKRLLFRNESEYIPRNLVKNKLKIKNKIVIIGGCVGNSFEDYKKTSFFYNEQNLIDYLSRNNINFFYCGHPSLKNLPRDFFKININSFSSGIKNLHIEECLLIGHYSTAVFELIRNNEIFLFNEASNHLGPEFNELINHPSLKMGDLQDIKQKIDGL